MIYNFVGLLAYDDACHLKRFIDRRSTTPLGKALAQLKIVVDKMHFRNHTDPWCKKNVNPYKCPDFVGINTEACEQTFRYVARFKYATKHMSKGMYNLFHFTMADTYNMDKLVLSNIKRKPKK